jgi:hypothetical protein
LVAACGSTAGPTTAGPGADGSGESTLDSAAPPVTADATSGGVGDSSGGAPSQGDDGATGGPSDASGAQQQDGSGPSGDAQSPGDGGSTDGHSSPSDAAHQDGSGPADGGATVTDAAHPDGSGPADGSTSGSDGGTGTTGGDAGSPPCKRGIASNAAPGSVFSPSATQAGVSWWYSWSLQGTGQGAGIEFVPMIWGTGSLHSALPSGSRYVLGFNEPNFKSQSNLTPAQAAADWPAVQTAARAVGALLVAPAVNFCGSASNTSGCSDPAVTDPYTWLKDFFADCTGCQVDGIAVHWYNCDLPSLRAYIEGNVDAGGGLQGFVQFGKPIWLTEFSCDGSHTVADQKAYMQAAVPYLENNPHVFRYSWFSAGPIPNAELANSDGTLNDLGTTYVGLPESCR